MAAGHKTENNTRCIAYMAPIVNWWLGFWVRGGHYSLQLSKILFSPVWINQLLNHAQMWVLVNSWRICEDSELIVRAASGVGLHPYLSHSNVGTGQFFIAHVVILLIACVASGVGVGLHQNLSSSQQEPSSNQPYPRTKPHLWLRHNVCWFQV